MLTYNMLLMFNILTLLFSVLLEKSKKKSFVNLYLLFFFLSLFLISGFRASTIGTDTQNYESIFLSIGHYGKHYYNFWKFPGYSFYNLFLYKISSWPQILIIMNSFIITLGFVISFKKWSISPYISSMLYIVLYHYFVTMNATRQYISILLLFLSLHYYTKRKSVFIIFFIMAITVHQVSLLGISYFILYKINWSRFKYFILFIITPILSFLMSAFSRIFVRMFSDYESYFNMTGNINLSSTGSGNKLVLSTFLSIFIMMGLLVVHRNKDKNDKKYRFMLACVLISFILDILFSKNIMMIRVALYFNIIYLYFIPYTIHYFSGFFKESISFRVYMYIFTLLVLLIPYYYQLSRNMVDVIPYQFFL